MKNAHPNFPEPYVHFFFVQFVEFRKAARRIWNKWMFNISAWKIPKITHWLSIITIHFLLINKSTTSFSSDLLIQLVFRCRCCYVYCTHHNKTKLYLKEMRYLTLLLALNTLTSHHLTWYISKVSTVAEC